MVQPAAFTYAAAPEGERANGMKLDRIDMKILAEVQRNGRITNVNLADAVGLSASPCLRG